MKVYDTTSSQNLFVVLTVDEAIKLAHALLGQIRGLPVHGGIEMRAEGGRLVEFGVRPEEEKPKKGR